MELMTKQGYKQTEVGLIPEDWSTLTIEEVANVIAGGTPSTSISSYWNGDIEWFTPTEISGAKYSSESVRKISKAGFNNCSAQILPKGAILMTTRASIGDLSILLNEACTNQGFQSLISKKDVDNEFLYYLMQTKESELLKNASGSTFLEISPTKIKAIRLPFPPTLTEQKAIATALSDADKLISSLELLITKKKAIKQGAMQRLLTPPNKGGKRLPGFSGEWVEKSIKEIVSTPVTDGPHETPKFVREGIPFLSVNNIVNNKINESNLRYISKEDDLIYSQKCKPIFNDILLGKAASVGKVAIVEKNWDFNIWSPLALIRCKSNINPSFVFYSFQTKQMANQIDGLTNSSSQGNIGMVDIEKLKISFPKSFEEQNCIAELLSNIAADIEQLETKKAKYQSIKQGMMQELLTGKTRLV